VQLPYELDLGWRYTRSGVRRDGFIGFISAASMIGIALGVAALIIVLSVMNGFQKEVRDRMLSVLAHIEVVSFRGALDDWPKLAQAARGHPQVLAAAPYVGAQALLQRGEALRGVLVRGVDPVLEPQVSDIAQQLRGLRLDALTPGGYGVILGSDLARALGVVAGDKLTLVAPSAQLSIAGSVPRMRTLTVLGSFESGHAEFDGALALLHLDDAARIFQSLAGDGSPAPSGLRLKIRQQLDAPLVAAQLQQRFVEAGQPGLSVRDWTRQNRNWFAAVQVEKRMMSLILTLIIAVAAFNLVSTLVMTVNDKRGDIAILRTLGASPRSIMAVFVAQGALVGVVGTAAGVALGCLVAYNVDVIVPAIEQALGVAFLPKDIYLISRMPSDPRAGDIVPIALVSLALALLATLYPSWRAARTDPAEALRYE
jgi:lipoprotein-releasing system permease protein